MRHFVLEHVDDRAPRMRENERTREILVRASRRPIARDALEIVNAKTGGRSACLEVRRWRPRAATEDMAAAERAARGPR